MTYEQAIEWLEKNVPTSDYDEFSDWYKVAEEKLNTPNLFSSPEFNKMLEDVWLNQYGSFSKKPISIEFRATTVPSLEDRIKSPSNTQTIPVILPEKEISKPVVVVPPNIPPKEKKNFLDRVKGIFNIFNRFRRKK